jgi:hypothetical protein
VDSKNFKLIKTESRISGGVGGRNVEMLVKAYKILAIIWTNSRAPILLNNTALWIWNI